MKSVYIRVCNNDFCKTVQSFVSLQNFVQHNQQKWATCVEKFVLDKHEDKTFVESAVLIPIIQDSSNNFSILLTVRHPKISIVPKGEVCLPGGRSDHKDNHVIETALREAKEEIGLMPDNVEILFESFKFLSMASRNGKRHTVYPVFGLIKSSFYAKLNPTEVEDVLIIPFRDFVTRVHNFPAHILGINGEGITTLKTYTTLGFTYYLLCIFAYLFYFENPMEHLHSMHKDSTFFLKVFNHLGFSSSKL